MLPMMYTTLCTLRSALCVVVDGDSDNMVTGIVNNVYAPYLVNVTLNCVCMNAILYVIMYMCAFCVYS
jgi:hypothetical protein